MESSGPTGTAAPQPGPAEPPVTRLHRLRVVVDRIEGRSVCGLQPGDCFTVSGSSRLAMPDGGHFCLYALAAVLPLLPAQQRAVADGDWMATDTEVACPDPEERLIMRIERGAPEEIPRAELT